MYKIKQIAIHKYSKVIPQYVLQVVFTKSLSRVVEK
jgi:hypothetical protein